MSEVSSVVRLVQEVSCYKIYLCEDINEPKAHLEVMQALNTASSFDVVDLYINTCGGQWDTSVQIIDAIRNCEAIVTGHLVGEARSAGSMIFLSCDEMRAADYSTLMIHNYSGAAYGKGHELYTQASYMKKEYPKFFKEIYRDFLSEEEIENVLKGMDLWMESEEIRSRLEVMCNERAKRFEEEQEQE